jgi:hypothetical protein
MFMGHGLGEENRGTFSSSNKKSTTCRKWWTYVRVPYDTTHDYPYQVQYSTENLRQTMVMASPAFDISLIDCTIQYHLSSSFAFHNNTVETMNNTNQTSISAVSQASSASRGINNAPPSSQGPQTQAGNTNTPSATATTTLTITETPAQNQTDEVLRLTLQARPSVTW